MKSHGRQLNNSKLKFVICYSPGSGVLGERERHYFRLAL